MKTISKFCLLLLLLCTVKTAKADDEQDLYLIGLEDGAYTPLVISNLRSLSFTQTQEEASDGSSVYVNHMSANYQDGTSKVFDLSAYASMKFDTAPSAILDLNAEMPATNAIMFDGKQLIAQRAGVLKIYGIDGRQVSANAVAIGECVNLHALPAGMYIVQLAGTSAKILVK